MCMNMRVNMLKLQYMDNARLHIYLPLLAQTQQFEIPVAYAQQLVYERHPLVMDLLQTLVESWPVLLNRAPTLHRLSI